MVLRKLAFIMFLVPNIFCINADRPHIIFILADDLGWNDVGFHGSNQVPTPNIDALGYSGIILNNYYVMPVCTPSRSALMTGRHPIHTGQFDDSTGNAAQCPLAVSRCVGVSQGCLLVHRDAAQCPLAVSRCDCVSLRDVYWFTGMQHSVLFANEPWGLPLTETLLPEYLQQLGYVTRAVGKWHLGHFQAVYTPLHRGFLSHYGYWTGHQDYYDHTAQESLRYWGYDMRRGVDNITWSNYGHYTTDLLTDEAVQLIRQHNTSEPLFLYLAHLATHSGNTYKPLQAPYDTVKKFSYIENIKRRTFAGMLSKLDDSVGAVVAALGDRGMLHNSIIVFSTDNGGAAAGFNGNAASNWPLRGGKDTLWEGGVRGVGLIWSPLISGPPRVANHLMHIQDWLPTLLAAVNYTSDANETLDGYNLWPTILGDQPPPYDELLLNIDDMRNISAARSGDWKLVSGRTYDGNWDGWYGPSGRDSTYHYNTTLIESCPAGRALCTTTRPVPDPQTMSQLRSEALVSCATNSTLDPTDNSDLAVDSCSDNPCLFNVAVDPCELTNVASKHPHLVAKFKERIETYRGTAVEPNNKPADPNSNPKYWNYTWTHWKDFPDPVETEGGFHVIAT